jgi:hypothetical protein
MSWGKTKPEKFLDAVRESDISRLKSLWTSFDHPTGSDGCETWRQALDIAVRTGAEPTLRGLLSLRTDGFYVVKSGDDTPVVHAWFTHAATERNRLIWNALLLNNKPGSYGFQAPGNLLIIAMKAGWKDLASEIFSGIKSETDGKAYGGTLVAAVEQSAEIFTEVLEGGRGIANRQVALNAALDAAALRGDMAKADALIKHGARVKGSEGVNKMLLGYLEEKDWHKAHKLLTYGADPNFEDGKAILIAVANNQEKMFDHILAAGGNLAAYGEKLLVEMKSSFPKAPMLPRFEKMVMEACADSISQKEEARYTLSDLHTLSYVSSLPDNVSLTTLFNFQRCQQITIVKDTKGGQMAVETRNFEEVLSAQEISRLREKFEARGGKVEESAGMMKKVSLPSPGAAHGTI